jgi:glucose-1-phosphate adenylyltransferase
MGWDPVMSPELDEWIFTVPPQLRLRQSWYQGTADAIYQNIHLLEDQRPRHVVVLSGDHVYKMDYAAMLRCHEETGAVATIAAVDVPVEEAHAFGVLHVDPRARIVSFQEKPEQPEPIPGRPDRALVNMGVYCFDTRALVRALVEDARLPTRHDFGHDILPRLLRTGDVCAYPFVDAARRPLYWRDIGTLDAFYQASLDLLAERPTFDLYDEAWPIRTLSQQLPPAWAAEGAVLRRAIVGPGCVVQGTVSGSVLSPQVRVGPGAVVEEAVLMDGVVIGEGARVRGAIVDKSVRIPPGASVGHDAEADRQRFTVSAGGVVVIPKGAQLD